MSINVHVKGNPINVRSGGMVITNNSQEEFNKRRKIRLEQVRQQSKDLAHNVRKRIAKENKRQASSSEQHNLRKWQAQKLLEFEQKYQECLSSLEVPPKISTEISEEILVAEKTKRNRTIALERGERASERLQIEKNEKSMQKSVPIQQKKFAREIEKNRSLAITNFTKRKKSKNRNHERETLPLNLPNDSEQSGHREQEIQCDADFHDLCNEDKNNSSSSELLSGDIVDNCSSSSNEIPPKKIKRSHESKNASKIKVFDVMVHNEPKIKKGNKASAPSESPDRKQKDKNYIPKKLDVTKDASLNTKKPMGRRKPSFHISDRSSTSSPKKEPPIKQTIPSKPDVKRNPMRNKLFSGVESAKATVENVTSKSRLDEVCKLQHSLSSSPERPRSPIITHTERSPELKQQFILDKRISEHIMNRKFDEERRRDRDIQVKDDKKNALVQSDLNKSQFQTCLCSCYENDDEKMVSASVSCKYPESLSEKVQTCSTIERSCLTDKPKVKSTSTSQGVNECIQVNQRDLCERCNLSKADLNAISEECLNSSRFELKSTKTSSNSSKLTLCKDGTSSAKSVQIPTRPSVSLSKQAKEKIRPLKSETVQQVHIYDDSTKYSSTYAPANNLVQKIPINNLSVVIESSEDECLRKQTSRDDKYAEIRGQNALKKEKVCRDYEEIMSKLPLLQKKERIASIGKDDPKYHMSEERRKEYEKRKENSIEAAYENSFPKAVTITLPKRVPASEDDKLPYKVIDMRNGPTGINLGTWDINKDPSAPKHISSSSQTVKHTEQSPIENDENMLKNLLEKLIDQKEKLDKEVSRVPEGSRLHQILNDLECGFYNKKEQTREESENDNKNSLQKESSTDKKLHNTSTQTSPRSRQVMELPSAIACPCIVEHKKTASCEKLCEIVIKVGEEANQPKIQIKPSSNDEKGIIFTVKDLNEDQKNKGCDLNKSKRNTQKLEDATEKVAIEKPMTELYTAVTETQKTERSSPACKKISTSQDKTTWKHVLSQNSTNCTSSTSYMSPPNNISSVTKHAPDKRENSSDMCNILCRKPQQKNLNYESCESDENLLKEKRSNPELLNHIKHLLKMSHKSIEELNVSSVSSVSTPDSTLFTGETNKTISQLRSICKQYNLHKKDLEKMFSFLSSSSSNAACESTSSSSYKSASTDCVKLRRPAANETEKSPCGTSDSLQKLYEEMTAKCMEKIESLSALIENLREEKNKIITCQESSFNGEKEDSSTKYLEIEKRSPVLECDNSDKTKSDSSEFITSSQGGEDSLTKKLLEIDDALTERIKNLSKLEKSCTADVQPQNQCKTIDSSEEADNSLERELIFRYKNLVYDHDECKDKKQTGTQSHFVPFVSGISGLPKWEGLGPYASHIDEKPNKCTGKPNKPPPSRGLLNAKRFNDEIINYPHELSSITEVDSFTSSRIRRSTSPKKNSPKHMVEFAPDYNPEPKNDVNFPCLNSNFEDIKLSQKQTYPPPHIIDQEIAAQKCTRSACSSPKKTVTDRLVHSEQNSPKKMCSKPQELYQRGGEVLKRARELTTRIQNLSKSFEHRPCSPPCDNQEHLLSEEVHCKQKRKVIIEENSSSGSNESATDVESVEKMLKSLGMGWAVATLRKTQEALALTSSSSSVDLKLEREIKITDKNSSSEISLIECVKQRRHVSDLQSSNETNNDTSLHKYLQNISSIPASSSTFGRSTQRTSTPVNKNDSTIPASNLIYSGESDLSSVRHSSENKSSSFNKCVTSQKGSKR